MFFFCFPREYCYLFFLFISILLPFCPPILKVFGVGDVVGGNVVGGGFVGVGSVGIVLGLFFV